MGQKPIGVLLAGGKSSRMQDILTSVIQDKSLLTLGSKPLIMHIIERVKSQVERLIINANLNPDRFSTFGLPIISDTIGNFSGPLAGILAGMEWSQKYVPANTHILSIPTDVPFLPLDLVQRLQNGMNQSSESLVLARSNEVIHPVIGLWPVTQSKKLHEALKQGTRKVLDWTNSQNVLYVDFPPLNIREKLVDPFFNINTPQDLKSAEDLIQCDDNDLME